MNTIRLFTLGIITGITLYVFLYYSNINTQSNETRWIYDFNNHKSSLVNRIDTPKLIIASGSNALFSHDSRWIEESVGRPVVNISLAIGLGLDYLIDKVKQYAQPKDIVLLPLEYKFYFESSTPDALLTMHLLSDQAYVQRLPTMDRFTLYTHIPLRRLLMGVFDDKISSPLHEALYDVDNLNSYGEFEADALEHIRTNYIDETQALPSVSVLPPQEQSLNKLKALIAWAKSNRVELVFAPPASMHLDKGRAQDVFEQIKRFYEAQSVKILPFGDWHQFPRELMMETNYHVSQPARKVYTGVLIELLSSRYGVTPDLH